MIELLIETLKQLVAAITMLAASLHGASAVAPADHPADQCQEDETWVAGHWEDPRGTEDVYGVTRACLPVDTIIRSRQPVVMMKTNHGSGVRIFDRSNPASMPMISCIGTGPLGAKADGLHRIFTEVLPHFDEQGFPGISVDVPRMVVLSADSFGGVSRSMAVI